FVGASLVVMVIDIFFAFRKGIHISYSFDFRMHLQPLLFFFLTSVSVSIYTFMDTYLLGLISGSLAVGFYTTAFKMVTLPQRFVQDISAILLPRLSFLAVEKNTSEINRLLQKAILFVLTIAVPLGVLFLSSAREIIMLIGGRSFLPAAITLQILSFLPLVIGISTAFANQVLIPLDKEKELLKAVTAGSISSILFCFLLCPVWQHNGAAIACLLAELVVMLFSFYISRKVVEINISVRQVSGIIFSGLLFFPLVFFLRSITGSSALIFSATALMGAAGYFLLQLYLFRNPIVQELYAYVKTFFR
ncbi:MAG: polysaccharide biosynthesis C-terminal domain-containing protein, partial [Flavisolibacter sp.]|nr:polysaccharide biosynthesis C-terminal domain-containing protein [Flavisolibacter sp.]